MRELKYDETKAFYKSLDSAIRQGEPVDLVFNDGRPPDDSPLWQRVKRCRNGKEVVRRFKGSWWANEMGKAGFVFETATIITIAVLLTGLITYGIYKRYNIVVEVDPTKKRFVLKFNPG